MKEELKKIFKMVEEKKITAEEAEKLIDAMDDGSSLPDTLENGAAGEPRLLRVHVVDEDNNVDINLPISLVEVGLKIGSQMNFKGSERLKDIDFNMIMEAVRNGARGKIVNVKSTGTIVEVYVE